MRPLAPTLLLALAALSGCPNPPPFDLTITNAGTVTTYLDGGNGSGVRIGLAEQVQGEWASLVSNLAFLCAERCGVPGQIVCADVAFEPASAFALLPGESTEKSFDGELWYLDARLSCAKRAPLTGAMRATVCHDDAVVDENGAPLPPATESGPMGSGGGEVRPADPLCEELPFELAGDPVVLEIVE